MKEDEKVEQETNTRRKYEWLKFFFVGTITYIIGLAILIITGNSIMFPSVILLGNFLFPVTYVAFFYGRRHLSNVRMANIVAAFFYGGFMGTFASAILEPIFVKRLDVGTAILVGVIEEFAKVFGVFLLIKKRKYTLEMDGIILGATAGMGFAALESSGYAFSTFLKSGGNLTLTVYTTLLRGVFSPLAHGTWTAILIGVLLREKKKSKLRFNSEVLSAYVTVVLLHGLWDGFPSIVSSFIAGQSGIFEGYAIIGIVGILILYTLWREAKKQAYDQQR